MTNPECAPIENCGVSAIINVWSPVHGPKSIPVSVVAVVEFDQLRLVCLQENSILRTVGGTLRIVG